MFKSGETMNSLGFFMYVDFFISGSPYLCQSSIVVSLNGSTPCSLNSFE